MYQVKVYEPREKVTERGKLVATHKYPTINEAHNAAFALRGFPRNRYVLVGTETGKDTDPKELFGYKTVVL